MRVDPALAPVLADRARRLARPVADDAVRTGADGLLRFTVGREAFAVPTGAITEVQPVSRPAPLPHGPNWLAGMLGIRGRMLPALWLNRFVSDGQVSSEEEADRAVVVRADGIELGMLATTVGGISPVQAGDMEPLPRGLATATRCAVGIHDGYLVVDPTRLVHDVRAALGASSPIHHARASTESAHGDEPHART